MAVKLCATTGECVCSTCYEPVDIKAASCSICGSRLEGTSEAHKCSACDKLVGVEEEVCPLCNERIASKGETGESIPPTLRMDGDDEVFLKKLLTWTQGGEMPRPDTVEDRKERDQAMKVLRSITVVEPDESMEEQVKEIKETAEEREELERRRRQLLKLGKPFETILERNIINVNLLDKELDEVDIELTGLKGKKGKEADSKREKLRFRKGELQTKKDTLLAYEENILMIGGAYRRLLEIHQEELYKIEAELKKRVGAFQKEVGRRKKQKERLKKMEESLDKREEELSNRFLEFKKRENEILAKEDTVSRAMEELKNREKEIARMQASAPAGTSPDMHVMGDEGFKEVEEDLKEREAEIVALKEDIDGLRNSITEKDKEIESLKANESEFSVDEETRNLLQILDELLEKLPEKVVDKFARSDDYLLYERVLEKYKL